MSTELSKITEKLSNLLQQKQPVLFAIDGYGGSGKSTLAKDIQLEFPGSIIITLDDFATSALNGTDRDRFLSQVLRPLSEGKHVRYQRYDWKKESLADWIEVLPEGLIILEGVSLLSEDFNHFYDFRIWIDCPHELASKRGMERDKNVHKVDNDEKWVNVWIKEEQEYAKSEPWTRADLVFRARVN